MPCRDITPPTASFPWQVAGSTLARRPPHGMSCRLPTRPALRRPKRALLPLHSTLPSLQTATATAEHATPANAPFTPATPRRQHLSSPSPPSLLRLLTTWRRAASRLHEHHRRTAPYVARRARAKASVLPLLRSGQSRERWPCIPQLKHLSSRLPGPP